MSFFDSVEMQPEDPILGMAVAFRNDKRPIKVNLGIGSYKNAEGHSQVLSCVRKAEKIVIEKNLDKEYLPILGGSEFIQESLKLVFGDKCSQLTSGTIAAAQTLGGTGALRIGGEFLFQNQISRRIFLSDPSWPNHKPIFQRSGLTIDSYTYYDNQRHTLNFSGMCASIAKIPPGSVVLLQPCCHNPTGMDPAFEQWKELSDLIKHHKLIPFFDLAYQGFDMGLEKDAQVVRYFADEEHEMLVSSSFSKNSGLYGERVGLLSIVSKDKEAAARINSQLKLIVRGSYSMPPLSGQRIMTEILKSEALKKEWVHELEAMRLRIKEMRKTLVSLLQTKAGGNGFQFLTNQTGMFSFSGLNEDQVHRLRQDYGIYMLKNGRINVAGLNSNNMEYVANSILAVI